MGWTILSHRLGYTTSNFVWEGNKAPPPPLWKDCNLTKSLFWYVAILSFQYDIVGFWGFFFKNLPSTDNQGLVKILHFLYVLLVFVCFSDSGNAVSSIYRLENCHKYSLKPFLKNSLWIFWKNSFLKPFTNKKHQNILFTYLGHSIAVLSYHIAEGALFWLL